MRFLKANSVFDGKKMLPENTVLVLNDTGALQEIIQESAVERGNIEHLDGILMPGFVNTHCHLELSHLKDQVPQHTGLPGFARHIITQRSKFSKEEIAERALAADKEMWQNGSVAVGDISNGTDSFAAKNQSKLFYHTFVELIGLNPANQTLIFDKGLELLQQAEEQNLSASLAPHAPYSTSTELIKKIADYNAASKRPLSIHNQESEEEEKFFLGKKNGFDELYKFLGLDLSWYKAPGMSSLQSFVNGLSQNTPSVLVHNTFTKKEDIIAANHKNAYWCFCPGANLYIENTLPDFPLFTGVTDKICFGTDSLASNNQLNVLEEANLILKNTSAFSLETILQGLTSTAAEALGIAVKFGSLLVGKNAGLNLIDLKHSQLSLTKKIV